MDRFLGVLPADCDQFQDIPALCLSSLARILNLLNWLTLMQNDVNICSNLNNGWNHPTYTHFYHVLPSIALCPHVFEVVNHGTHHFWMATSNFLGKFTVYPVVLREQFGAFGVFGNSQQRFPVKNGEPFGAMNRVSQPCWYGNHKPSPIHHHFHWWDSNPQELG